MGNSSSTPSRQATTPPQRPNAGERNDGAGSQTTERVSITGNVARPQLPSKMGTSSSTPSRQATSIVFSWRPGEGHRQPDTTEDPPAGSRWICRQDGTGARLRARASGRDVSDEIAEHLTRAFLGSFEASLGLRTSGRKTACKFSVGQKVKICGDKTRVKLLQLGHGRYSNDMESVLGRVGTVAHIYFDGDIQVNFRNGRSWCFNPDLAEAVSDDESESSDSDSEVPDALQRMMRDLLGIDTTGDGMVRKLQLTPFLVACHQGDESFVMASITTGANVNEKNNHGDTALHFGAYGDKPAILELLVNLGADINAKNKKGYTALHVAVNKDSVACVRVLTNYISDLNVNTQDEYGDTPLHDAIRKANNDIVDLLVNFRSIDFTVKNKRGFNAFHYAALKGNIHAMERLLSKKLELVDSKKEDGYTCLHLAAVNNHYSIAKLLLTKGRCMVDLKNVKGETALLLAVHNGHCELAELLVEAGADINEPDEDGNTPMHMILLRLQKIKIVSDVTSSETNLSLACFLANKGGDLYKKNKAGKTPLDVAGGTKFVEWLLRSKMAPRAQVTSSSEQSKGGATAGAASEDGKCKMCCDAPASVWFEPCGHRLYCPDCCRRMKCCLSCGERITGKVSDGERPADNESQQRELEARLRRLEEAHTCIICMERERNVAFMCGHVACDRCAANLSDCHICRNPIDKRITLF
ncbi:E3 ubiquitin-protein ligase MIB2 isoform X4 [Rhipicephalus microplus]|uniref:E3 ubiquitin-protein ligase MIB2 isoform X4 n=2 Tax=Rhipicephalus microplus TaxID=6941 RepID=UPI003F6D54A8